MKESKKFFEELIETPSPSGYEEPIQKLVRTYADHFADRVITDVHGNVMASRNPDSPFKIMLSGHCDQIGFIVNYIDNEGFIYVQSLGGWDPQIAVGSRIILWGQAGPVPGIIGRKPIHLLNEDERKKVVKIQDLWIDIGANNKEEVEKVARVGDCVTAELAYHPLLNNRVAAVGTDDKSGVWVIMEALRLIDPAKLKVGVYAVSTVQEEVGLRGARTSAFGINPQVGIAVDVTFATDCPTIDKKINGDVTLGGGPVIAKGPNLNMKLTAELLKIGEEHKIPNQLAAEGRITGTDAAVIQINRSGVATGLVSIPNRYMHTPVEIVSWDDMENAAKLLARYCESVTPEHSYIPGI